MTFTPPRNLTLKALALALAALLWVHVATDKTYEVELTLPVTVVTLDSGVALAEAPPDSIVTQITATGKDLMRRAWRRAGIELRLKDQRLGQRDVQLSLSNVSLVSGEGISFTSVVWPRSHRFNFDRSGSIEVDVLPRVTITPAAGFAVSQEQQITPARVTASGPQSSLERMKKAFTEPRTLQDVRSDFDLKLNLVTDGLYGVTFDPPQALYRVSVTVLKERLIDSLPIALLNAPGFPCELSPAFVSVRVSGGADVIDQLEPHQISVTTDYQNRAEAGDSRINVSLPLQIELESISDTATQISPRS